MHFRFIMTRQHFCQWGWPRSVRDKGGSTGRGRSGLDGLLLLSAVEETSVRELPRTVGIVSVGIRTQCTRNFDGVRWGFCLLGVELDVPCDLTSRRTISVVCSDLVMLLNQNAGKRHYHRKFWLERFTGTTTRYRTLLPNDSRLFPYLSLIHIWRCRRSYACRSRWSPYH